MKKYMVVFSPTGGTEKDAKAITQNWKQTEMIDLTLLDTDYTKISFEKDSIVLIAMPSFGGVAPELALERLSMLKGNGAICAITAVYGNRAYEDTLIQMKDYAQKAGFQVIAAVSAVAEHSIIREFAAGRPNVNDCEELSDFGDRILEKACSGVLSTPMVPGNKPYKKSGSGMIPEADDTCIDCGLCARKCPTGAISEDQIKISDKNKCISCMRCVSICPVDARHVSQVLISVVSDKIKKACLVKKENELFI